MRVFGLETYSAVTHVLYGIVIGATVALVAFGLGLASWDVIGAAYAVAFFHGREQRDSEVKRAATGTWFWPWQYPAKSQWDFWPVIFAAGAIIALLRVN